MRSRPPAAGGTPAPESATRGRREARPALPPPLPSVSELLDPRAPFLAPLLLLVVARVAFWLLVREPTEDAYITFRYARSLASGHGLTYNPGERVMGFSSPPWAIWNALGIALLGDPVPWARGWSVAADAVTLVAMGALLRRHASRASAWAFALFFAAWPYFSAVAVSGMETSAMLAAIAVAAVVGGSRAAAASGPALAGLALMRPEGTVAAAILAFGARGRDRIVALVLFAAGVAALASYFGSPIPQSVVSKAGLYGTPGPIAGRFWWEWLFPFMMGRWPPLGETAQLVALAVVMGPAFAVGIGALWRSRRTALALAVAGALSVWAGYALLGVAFFWWYLAVPLAGVAAAAAVGLPRLVRGKAIPAGCALFVLGMWTIAPRFYVARSGEELSAFRRTAELLRARCTPGEKAMLEPIGMIGYYAPLVVVDEVGLVSPRVAERRLRGAGWYADIVAAERPEWLVVRRGTLRTGEAFAGAGAPFRRESERDSVFARYRLVDAGLERSGDRALAVLRRAH